MLIEMMLIQKPDRHFGFELYVSVCGDLKLQKLAQNHLNKSRAKQNRKFFLFNHFCAKNKNYQIDFDFYLNTHTNWHPINWIEYSRQLHKT